MTRMSYRKKFKKLQDSDERWTLGHSILFHVIFKIPSAIKVPITNSCDKLCTNTTFISKMNPSIKALNIKMLSKLLRFYAICIIISSCNILPLASADTQSAPHFVVQPSFAGGVVTEGQSKILQCQAVGFPAPEYIWYRNDKPLGNFTQDPLLRLHHITKEDSGQYWCLAKNTAGTVFSDKTTLTVAYMGSPSSTEDISITVKDGEAAILNPPSVKSVPAASVSWQKIGYGRLHGINYAVTLNNDLVLLATSKDDEGQYQASLTNSHAGQETSGGMVLLHVIGDRKAFVSPEIIVPPKDSVFKQGTYPAVLECIVNARPLDEIDILWKKDGVDISASGLSPHLYMLSPWNRTITLLNVGPVHGGIYECEVFARNIDSVRVSAAAEVTVIVEPSITLGPSRETISELGKIVFLPCSNNGNPAPDVIWFKNAIEVMEVLERFEILPNGTLKISDLTSLDTGTYQCVVKNSAGEATASTWLHVKISSPDFIKAPVNVTVLDGKDAQIHCEVSGAPAPNVTWIFNDVTEIHSIGRIQILDSGSLLIASTEASDVGKYTCSRMNSAGSVQESAYLTVLVRTQIIQPPVDTKVILSSNAELQCKVSHDPAVPYKIHWYFGNKEIFPSSGGRIQILPDGSLRIGQARNTDVGIYSCKVFSDGGNETRSARLDVIELPHPPNNVQATLENSYPKKVNVSWSKAFDGNSPITNYIVQMRVVPNTEADMEFLLPWTTAKANISGSQRHVMLTNLKPASSYEFRVSAVNGVGEGNPSAPTEVIHLPPEPPSGPPQGVVGGARSSTSIMLQWQHPAENDRNGDLLGYVIRYKLAGYSASPWAYHNITNEAQHSFLLQDLIVWQNYEIQVAAYNEMGIGVFSGSIYIRTREGVPQSAPSDVRAEAINSTAVHVWWKPPDPQLINGINQGYKLQTWINDPNSGILPSHTVLVAPSPLDPLAEQDSIVGSLEKYTSYNITVLCFTSPGDGPKSDAILITTKQDVPDAVKNLKFDEILDTSILVLWSPPDRVNGILKGYTLKYHVKDVLETTVIRNLSAEATQVKVTDLRPTTAYTFEIFAWTVVGPGPEETATIQSGIPPVLPGPPTKLAVSNIGAFSVVLQFTPGFDGNTSIIKWTVEAQTRRNESWWKIYEVSDPEASNILVKNLMPFTEYKLRLIATNVVGSSEPSEPSKFFQTIQAPPSHPPYNVTVRAVNANALRVRWTPLQQVEWFGIPRGYNILHRECVIDSEVDGNSGNETYELVTLEDHNANSYVIKNLEEFTDYEISVQAFNDVGSSSPSLPAREKTREAAPSAGPTDVKINATSSTTIVVKWNEVPKIHQNGIIEGYKVYYGAKNVLFQYKIIESNSTFTTTLTELKKYTLYSVQVLAFSRIGDGVLSVPPVSVRTFEDVPGVPSNISFPDVSTTTARILWDVPEEPNGVILAYRVSYKLDNSVELDTVKELAPTERTLKVINLMPESYYMFSLTAQTNEGWGKTAYAKVFTTNNREAPQPPSPPQISNSQVQARQISFSWTPGRDGFAPLRFYTVQMAKNDDSWKTVAAKVDPNYNKYTVTNLKPYTPYKFRIQATNDIGSSGWSPESNLTWTLPAAPERAPRQVYATPYTTTSVRVNWEALSGEDWNGDSRSSGYRVEYCQITGYSIPRTGDCPADKIQGANSTSLSLHQLERDRVYEIRVYAYNSRGDSPPSLPVQVFVGEAVPTGEPQQVRVDAISSTELKVSWKPPPPTLQNGDLLGYKIFYEPRSTDGFEEMEAVPPTTTSYVLLDLKKFTEYSIQILAFNPAGDGPRSSPQFVTTMEDIPGPPGSLVFSDVTMTSLNVSWSPPVEPNGRIAGYLVTYETAVPDIDFSKQVKQKVTSPSLSVHGLAEAVTYTFRVRAETFDYGPESVGNITTGPQEGSPSAPEELILKHTHTQLVLQWKNGYQGASPIIGYLVERKQVDGNEGWTTLVLLNNGPQTSHAVSFRNLLPSTSYQFRLFARNNYGISFPAVSAVPYATPSKLFLEYRQKLPFYREVWFLVMLASVSIVIIILVVSVLCVKSKVYKYKKEAQKSVHDDHMSMDDGGFATFELRQSKRGTLCKNSLSRKNNNAILTKSPPRPSPGSVTYSDDDDTKGYDENCDSSSLTEKPSEMSSSESQGSDSDRESDGKCDPHSFVNHYANVNDTLRQSWKRQRPVVKPPSYTDSEPEGSIQVSLNGGHIVMNNMAGSRAPLPGFSSFV